MKNYIGILLTFILSNSYCQTKFDIVDFNNINYSLLSKLTLDACNNERDKLQLINYKKHDVCYLAAEYQSNYMCDYNRITHNNDLSFRGIQLKEFDNRVDFFAKKLKKYVCPLSEICLGRIYHFDEKITYEKLSYEIINQFMNSKSHKSRILWQSTCRANLFCEFSISSRKKESNIQFYVTGIIGFMSY
jgi:hypothetical protein